MPSRIKSSLFACRFEELRRGNITNKKRDIFHFLASAGNRLFVSRHYTDYHRAQSMQKSMYLACYVVRGTWKWNVVNLIEVSLLCSEDLRILVFSGLRYLPFCSPSWHAKCRQVARPGAMVLSVRQTYCTVHANQSTKPACHWTICAVTQAL